jgi:hypothetical protein
MGAENLATPPSGAQARRLEQRTLADTSPALDQDNTTTLHELIDRGQLALTFEQVLHGHGRAIAAAARGAARGRARGDRAGAARALARAEATLRPAFRIFDAELGLARAWAAATRGDLAQARGEALRAADSAGGRTHRLCR